MSEAKTYVRTDEHGALRVADTRVMLDSVVAAFLQGDSPESIQQQYPALMLEHVYGAIAYFLANRNEIVEYLRRQSDTWDKWREKAERQPSHVLQRLRAVNTNEAVAEE